MNMLMIKKSVIPDYQILNLPNPIHFYEFSLLMTWTVRKSVERNYKINALNDYQDCHYLSGRPNNVKTANY